ncbi:ATP-binding protein [Actinomadura parmotrematis]|uniref:ATPase n=1 Tax=Actinomadura parmotrematis TaxID=2864039 RepID=A0ABS7FRW2_9ACTN|nr:AAA family ATPase [Actinomadura parmotrematis]MBW8483141.1 ATPase [Actinomadura parmotrematis]
MTRARRPGRPPAATGRLVGRGAELDRLTRLCRAAPLVTVTGVGGVGKTRLALRAAAELEPAFPDGVWWVELSPVEDAASVPYAIAEALPLVDQTRRPMPEVLTGYLAPRDLLLVLDTCEHLAGACARVAGELLAAAPGLRILATSRRPLGPPGERVVVLDPLFVPDAAAVPAPGAPGEDAVTLLAERARAADPEFRITAANRADAVRLCRRLDGLPLAIELAAARLGELPVGELADRLADRFALLGDGGTAVPDADPPWHRSLRTAIGWSHELCGPAERLLWARLSVFPGEFDAAAARAVCADARLPAERVDAALESLERNSILLCRPAADGPRFRQLDTLREYGRSWLRLLGEEGAVRRRHHDHYLALARRFDAAWHGPGQIAAMERVRLEMHNVRAALEHGLAEPERHHAALDLAGRLVFLWIAHAPKEGAHHLDRALAGRSGPSPERARALWSRAWLAIVLNEPAEAASRTAECRRLAAWLGDEEAAAYALSMDGAHQALFGDPARAADALCEAADRHRGRPDRTAGLLTALIVLSTALLRLGDVAGAIGTLEEARALSERHGEEWLRSYCDLYQVKPELAAGRPDAAERRALAALAAKVRIHDTLGVVLAIDALAGTAVALGDAGRGARLLGATRVLAEDAGIGLRGLAELRVATAEGEARAVLGDGAYDAAFQQGRALDRDGAVAYALRRRPHPEYP